MVSGINFYSISYYPSDHVSDEEKQLIKDFCGGWRCRDGDLFYQLHDPARRITIIDKINEHWIIKEGESRRDAKIIQRKHQPQGDWDSIHVFRWLMWQAGLMKPYLKCIADYEC